MKKKEENYTLSLLSINNLTEYKVSYESNNKFKILYITYIDGESLCKALDTTMTSLFLDLDMNHLSPSIYINGRDCEIVKARKIEPDKYEIWYKEARVEKESLWKRIFKI